MILALDKGNYQYSLVSGPDRDYLWILSRTPTLPDKVMRQLLDKARDEGFPVDELIYVKQTAFN